MTRQVGQQIVTECDDLDFRQPSAGYDREGLHANVPNRRVQRLVEFEGDLVSVVGLVAFGDAVDESALDRIAHNVYRRLAGRQQ